MLPSELFIIRAKRDEDVTVVLVEKEEKMSSSPVYIMEEKQDE